MWFLSSVRLGIETQISFLATKRKVSAYTRVLWILCYALTSSEQVYRPVFSYKDSLIRNCNPTLARFHRPHEQIQLIIALLLVVHEHLRTFTPISSGA
jgi:hypothetical protein